MSLIIVSCENNICHIQMNRAPVNAVNGQMHRELIDVFTDASEQDDIHVVLLSSTVKGFCAGQDLKDGIENTSNEHFEQSHAQRLATRNAIYHCKKPVIAAVHGFVIGFGVTICSVCDVIVAAENTYFSIPEIRHGHIGAGTGANILVPDKLARYMAYTGNSVSVAEVAKFGAIKKVVPKSDLLKESMQIARDISSSHLIAVQYFKQAFNQNQDNGLAAKADLEYNFAKKLRQKNCR